MQVESLKVFCDLAETESFTKAAQIDSVTQFAVSRRRRRFCTSSAYCSALLSNVPVPVSVPPVICKAPIEAESAAVFSVPPEIA